MQREDTTTFVDGKCRVCESVSHTLADGGEYCDGCGRRVASWVDAAMAGEYDG